MGPNVILNALFILVSVVAATSLPGRYARIVQPRTVSNTTYDFVIIGGGIGGLTVADRLTEDPNGIAQQNFKNIVADKPHSHCFGCRVWPI